MTASKGSKKTKADITKGVATAEKERTVKFGGTNYIIRKLKWNVAIPLYDDLRLFMTKALPSMMGIDSGEDVKWDELLTTAPLELVVKIINATTPLDINLDTDIEETDEMPELELILFLACESFRFNFVDSEGVQHFFGLIRGVVNVVETKQTLTSSNLPSSKSKESFVGMDLVKAKGKT